MKKLIVALFAVACVAAVNGAQVAWKLQANSVADANGAGMGADKTVYMVLASSLASEYENKTAIAASSVSSGNFTIASKSAYASGTYQNASLAVGDKATYYLVLVDDANKRYSVFGTYTSSAATADGANDKSEGVLLPAVQPTLDTNKVALSSATWTAYAPEPTSGLLMLVGFGALALRRRKA